MYYDCCRFALRTHKFSFCPPHITYSIINYFFLLPPFLFDREVLPFRLLPLLTLRLDVELFPKRSLSLILRRIERPWFLLLLRLRKFFRDNRREYLDRFQKSEDVIIPSCNQGYRLRMLMGATVNKARKIPAFQPNDWNY